jgi:hypothetical protein
LYPRLALAGKTYDATEAACTYSLDNQESNNSFGLECAHRRSPKAFRIPRGNEVASCGPRGGGGHGIFEVGEREFEGCVNDSLINGGHPERAEQPSEGASCSQSVAFAGNQ